MKTPNDLFIAFTTGKNPELTFPSTTIGYENAKAYRISEKQAKWLTDLIFQEMGAGFSCASQLRNRIGNFTYGMMPGKKHRILVKPL